MEGEHCEMIKIGDDVNTIVCGVTDDCDHDFDGEWWFLVTNKESGEDSWVKKEDIPFDNEYKMEEWYKQNIITSGTSSCSKCGKLTIESMGLEYILKVFE